MNNEFIRNADNPNDNREAILIKVMESKPKENTLLLFFFFLRDLKASKC